MGLRGHQVKQVDTQEADTQQFTQHILLKWYFPKIKDTPMTCTGFNQDLYHYCEHIFKCSSPFSWGHECFSFHANKVISIPHFQSGWMDKHPWPLWPVLQGAKQWREGAPLLWWETIREKKLWFLELHPRGSMPCWSAWQGINSNGNFSFQRNNTKEGGGNIV